MILHREFEKRHIHFIDVFLLMNKEKPASRDMSLMVSKRLVSSIKLEETNDLQKTGVG